MANVIPARKGGEKFLKLYKKRLDRYRMIEMLPCCISMPCIQSNQIKARPASRPFLDKVTNLRTQVNPSEFVPYLGQPINKMG